MLPNQITERKHSERQDLPRRLVTAQENERQRISHELHDQLGQQLSSLILKLAMLKDASRKDSQLRQSLEGLEKLAREADEELDFLIWKLRPTALDELDLKEALAEFVEIWSRRFNIPVNLRTASYIGRCTPEVETVLYRVVQEGLNNIAKHAYAKRVEITLNRAADAVSAIVRDDGMGFIQPQPVSIAGNGVGLLGMRERAALFGGSVDIQSAIGGGTTVTVRLPNSK